MNLNVISYLFALLFLLLFAQCAENEKTEAQFVMPEEEAFIDTTRLFNNQKQKLSEYGFFTGKLAELNPIENVLPYKVGSALFSDYAQKKRFIYLPKNTKINLTENDILEFPEGSILIKNFFYSQDQLNSGKAKIIETRLLVFENKKWIAVPYVWNDEQTEAYFTLTGTTENIDLKEHGMFEYVSPNQSQCKSCHEYDGEMIPLGATFAQLNQAIETGNKKINQFNFWTEKGFLTGWNDSFQDLKPSMVDYSNPIFNLNQRARAYLDVNCGHCHNPKGPAKNSGLDLSINCTNDLALGIMKAPVAAGKGSGNLQYDIVPGDADNSILLYRMNSDQPAIMMPETGRKLIHKEGVELIRNWINAQK